MHDPDSLSVSTLSVVVIAPDEPRRSGLIRALAGPQAAIVRDFTRYPGPDDIGHVIETDPDVVVVDLEPDLEQALEVVEGLCSRNTNVTVMVYAGHADPELPVRCMRAGAREYLADPLLPSVGEALVRAWARRDEVRRRHKATGKLLVFVGAKGGSGVTTVASNFAVALARESGAKVALIDLDLQLGDAALTLGITTKFTVLDALENTNRLDSDFLSVLFVRHSSGLAVLGAPDRIPARRPVQDGIEKLLRVAREDFPYVVVDAGSQPLETYDALFDMASSVYLVSQVGIAELRNANRFISRYFIGANSPKLEIVLNRFVAKNVEIDEDSITKALTVPARWKIPNDYAAARRAQNSGVAVALQKNQMAPALTEMAQAACGQAVGPGRKKKFSLFG
ncbi:MAG TPA: AAA family ATPase [Bryobacteraceae bacterium]|nr:AAA family ATPase [Bryobacteraceae bacterium]